MNARPVTLASHVHNSLSNYRTLLSFFITLMVSLGFAVTTLYYQSTATSQLLKGLAPYLATLIESQDRPEILRVIESISENKAIDILVVQNGIVMASTRNISEMDQPYRAEPSVFKMFGIHFGEQNFVSEVGIQREGVPTLNASIVANVPLRPLMMNTAFIAIFAFLVGLIISSLSAHQTKNALKRAIRPLEDLEKAIGLLAEVRTIQVPPIPIAELESIRRTIISVQTDLENTKEHLAQERAKKLNAESYKRLIHDLHNPVAALRQMLRLITDEATDESSRQEAIQSVPRIADQILGQVSAAKNNLENDITTLKEIDIRESLRDSFSQMKSVFGADANKIQLRLPTDPIVVAHDPALLDRAVKNLLENSLHACRNQVELALSGSKGFASIEVSDDGMGLENSDVTLFLQGRGRSSKANRQALGLASANHIVRSHGGKLIYRKSTMGGACFEIRLGSL